MAIYESGEDYLETIFILKSEKEFVRSIDVANRLGYSKPSVSRAMGILKKAELIVVDSEGYISLTTQGHQQAEKVYNRHNAIMRYFVEILGVSPETAKKDACRVEHDISDETYEKICEALKMI